MKKVWNVLTSVWFFFSFVLIEPLLQVSTNEKGLSCFSSICLVKVIWASQVAFTILITFYLQWNDTFFKKTGSFMTCFLSKAQVLKQINQRIYWIATVCWVLWFSLIDLIETNYNIVKVEMNHSSWVKEIPSEINWLLASRDEKWYRWLANQRLVLPCTRSISACKTNHSILTYIH